MPVVIAAVLMVLATLIVRRTALGLPIEAVGINRSAARFAGLSSGALLLIVYSFAGFRAAISGLIVAGDIRGPTPTTPASGWNWTRSWPWSSAARF